ncbi:MAG: AmmeMemoRadiSam system radical SAM enzyme [Candidatus Bipolaricaulia bacterium]
MRWYGNPEDEERPVSVNVSLFTLGVLAFGPVRRMNEAMLYDRLSEDRVRCNVCSHRCTIERGHRGICAVRENVDGRLVSLVYGRLIARDVDPIEKKPLYHFYPGTRAYSIATVGCNFTCRNCQNAYISQYPRDHGGRIVGDPAASAEIIADAVGGGCRSIAYTYSEPTVALEFVLECMRAAKDEGLANVWVSNGYFTRETADLILPFLDGINVDLKGITNDVYHEISGGNVRPVLDTIERLWGAGVWVEVTTLVIPGLNDSDDELRWTAEAIRGVSPEIPWHVSRFFPAYRLIDRSPTPVETLERASEIGRDVGLLHVYLGNVPGEGEETRCPVCGSRLIRRSGYLIRESRVRGGACPDCDAPLAGRFLPA